MAGGSWGGKAVLRGARLLLHADFGEESVTVAVEGSWSQIRLHQAESAGYPPPLSIPPPPFDLQSLPGCTLKGFAGLTSHSSV